MNTESNKISKVEYVAKKMAEIKESRKVENELVDETEFGRKTYRQGNAYTCCQFSYPVMSGDEMRVWMEFFGQEWEQMQ